MLMFDLKSKNTLMRERSLCNSVNGFLICLINYDLSWVNATLAFFCDGKKDTYPDSDL